MRLPPTLNDLRFIAACCSFPAAWTLAMTLLALAVRY
jgi:hypothetical protein